MINLRWFSWNENDIIIEMLNRSIGSFQKFLSTDKFRYVITAENIDYLKSNLIVKVDEIISNTRGLFWVPSGHLMNGIRKFCPQVRIFDETEILIDADVFCLREPKEFLRFLDGDKKGIIQSREGEVTKVGYGGWGQYMDPRTPPCCAGFMGFQGDYDITEDLLINFYKLLHMNFHSKFTQGAVIKAMEKDILAGEIFLLKENGIRYFHPKDYYFDIEDTKDYYCEMVHCIGGFDSEMACFRELIKKNLI